MSDGLHHHHDPTYQRFVFTDELDRRRSIAATRRLRRSVRRRGLR